MKNDDKSIDVAKKAILKAGIYLKQNFFKKHTQLPKKDRTTLLKEDIKSQEIIISTLKKTFPHDAIYAEEMENKLMNERTWIIDPLCGTYSYLRGVETWSVSVALMQNSKFVIGVVYQPLLENLFYCQSGQGVYLNKHSIKPSQVADLKGAFVSIEHAVFASGKIKTLDLISKIKRVRVGHGSGGDLAYVAAGYLDAVIKTDQEIEHFAGGRTLVEMAGGAFLDFTGQTASNFLDKMKKIDYIACANEKLARLLLQFVTKN